MEAARKPGLPCSTVPEGYSTYCPPSEGSGWLQRAASLVETQLACGKASVGAETIERTDADVPILPAQPPAGCRAPQLSETPIATGLVLLQQAEAALSLLRAISLKHIWFSMQQVKGQNTSLDVHLYPAQQTATTLEVSVLNLP